MVDTTADMLTECFPFFFLLDIFSFFQNFTFPTCPPALAFKMEKSKMESPPPESPKFFEPSVSASPESRNCTVTFLPSPRVVFVESCWNIVARICLKMQVYQTVASDDVAGTMLEAAAKLFNENYGVWAKHSGKAGK